jgi:hypothetical protein
MTLRPGSPAAVNLFSSTELPEWSEAYESYDEAVSKKAAVAPATTTKGLEEINRWWLELPATIYSQGYITSAQLCKVMEWKLKRGLFLVIFHLY